MTAHRAACFYANKGSGEAVAEAPAPKAAGKAKKVAEKEEAVEEPAAEKETTVKVAKKDKESEVKEAPVTGTPL